MSTAYTWYGVENSSVERLNFTDGEQICIRSTVDTGDEDYHYEMTLNGGWVFLALAASTRGGRTLRLRRGDAWYVDGQLRRDLAGAIDIDLSFSPFTNTLPIRRLNLPVGASAEIITAYVEAPSLRVSPDPQRYTRVADDAYLYESLDSDFSRRVTVDADGFVLDYPGLFRSSGYPGADHA